MATEQETEELVARGIEYHDLIAKFIEEHPEAVKSLHNEENFLAYVMLKECTRNMMFSVMVDLPGMMEPLKEVMYACFIQGYYRAWQETELSKLLTNQEHGE